MTDNGVTEIEEIEYFERIRCQKISKFFNEVTLMHSPTFFVRLLSLFSKTATIFMASIFFMGTELSAAEIKPLNECSAELTGPIVKGDAERLQEIRDVEYCKYFELSLSSPGGDLIEALKISEDLYGVITIIPKDQQCLASCALIFMASRVCSGSPFTCNPVRRMHPNAVLGFQAPFLISNQSAELVPLEQSFSAAVEYLALIHQSFSRISASVARTGYSQSMMHPDLLAKMFSTAPAELYTITTNDQFYTFDIGLFDDTSEPAISKLDRERAGMLCFNLLYDEYRGWNHSEYGFNDYDSVVETDYSDQFIEYRIQDGDHHVRFEGLNLGASWSGWCRISQGQSPRMLSVHYTSETWGGEFYKHADYSMAFPLRTQVCQRSAPMGPNRANC